MRVRHLKDSFWVVASDNDLLLYTPKGELVSRQVNIRVSAPVDTFPSATCICLVNIASSEEEMRAKIEELNLEKTLTTDDAGR